MSQPAASQIASDTIVKGEVSGTGALDLEGVVEGELRIKQATVHKGGRVYGALRADDVEISGEVQGEAYVRNLIYITTTGSVQGKVEYGRIAVEAGGDLSATVRNVPPQLIGDMAVSGKRGQPVTVRVSDLAAYDPDNKAAELVFSVSRPVNGFVALRSSPGSSVTRFTQADLEAGDVLFVHNGTTSGGASFDVVAADKAGATTGRPQTVQVKLIG